MKVLSLLLVVALAVCTIFHHVEAQGPGGGFMNPLMLYGMFSGSDRMRNMMFMNMLFGGGLFGGGGGGGMGGLGGGMGGMMGSMPMMFALSGNM